MINLDSRFLRKTGLLLLALGIFAGALLYVCALNLKYQKQNFETEARNTATIVRSAMDVVDGVATSLRALQGSRSDQAQSDSYAKTVISNYSFISGFGRFEKVSGDQLASFSALRNSIDGTTPFSVWWYDQDGNRVTNGINNHLGALPDQEVQYYPVTLLKSQESAVSSNESTDNTVEQPVLMSLAGFDIGSQDFIRSAISQASDSGKTALVKAPEFWPGSKSMLAIRTSYRDHEVPTSFKDRREKVDGGYWLELDINGLSKIDGSFDGMGLKFSLIENVSEYSLEASGSETLYYQPPEESGYFLSDFFTPHEWLNTFSVGDQTFTVALSRERGLTGKSLLASIASTLLFLALACVIVNLNNKRRKAMKKQRIQSEKLYREQHRAAVTLSSIGDAVLTVDVDSTVQYSNSAAEKLLDISGANIIGVPINSAIRMMDEQSRELVDDPKDNAYLTDTAVSSDRQLVRLDGTSMAVNLTVSPLLDISGERSGSVIVLRDISAERELTKQLEHQVNHDSLTGLANRFQFERTMEQLFETASEDIDHALCFIDLDRFKQVNDTCGHAAGDQLLVQLSQALRSKIRSEDMLARLGGDEFAVILNSCDRESVDNVVSRIHRFFKSFHFEYEGRVFPVRSSIGVVPFSPLQADLTSVLSAADSACYVAKKNGRNGVHLHSVEDALDTEIVSEELWMPRIQEALENDLFVLHVQPIARSENQSDSVARQHEILVRMTDAEGNLIYPIEFMKPAERYELMTQIDQWVISHSLQKIAQMPETMHTDVFSLNLSAASVNDSELIHTLKRLLTLYGINASQLCFDIDEDVVLNNLEVASKLVRSLRKMGSTVALDDFGAGVSSLSALRELPVKYLKIDGQFVTDIVHSAVDESMVRSIHCFAQSMGMETIAEKVETEPARALLNSIGINYIQGYVIAHPVPLDDYLTSGRLAA